MRKFSSIAATSLLAVFFILATASMWHDSAIFDETAHIGAGYSYLTERDMRLNPEHPPLVKDLAAFPLLFLQLNFPTNTNAWQNQVNGQWDQGGPFLFEFGNNAENILHAARFPIILLAVFFGALLFRWVRKHYGAPTALLTLFFYCFSPTVLAHSRFVTTDIAAALGFFIGITSFVWFLRSPTTPRIITTGILFGIVELLKFSLFLLAPTYIILTGVWLFAIREKRALELYTKLFAIFAIGAVVIWTVYAWHVWNYPVEKQLTDIQAQVGGFKIHAFVDLDMFLVRHSFTRPLGQYLFGVMMVTQRTAGGNSAYFLGHVSSKGWHSYFPTIFALKETLGFLILMLTALCLGIMRIIKSEEKSLTALRAWLRDHFAIFASITMVAIYWASSIANPLNIGIRHVLPTFPFLYFLTARELVLWIKQPILTPAASLRDILRAFYHAILTPIPKIFYIALLCFWITLGIIASFPFYLSYYNELAGGTWHGYFIATDSNYDWGQDLERLADFADKHPEQKIYLDYFGGSTAHNGAQKYWLGEQFVPWYSSFGPPPAGSYFAVSANSLMGSQAIPIGDFPPQKPEDTYPWLRNVEPFGRAGTSIFIYQVPNTTL